MKRLFAAMLSLALLFAIAPLQAQTLNNATVTGKFTVAPGPPPTFTTCTAGTGATDLAGSCTTTTTSATITFGTPRTIAPNCIVADSSATPVAVWTVSATAITVSAATNAHVLRWWCADVSGG